MKKGNFQNVHAENYVIPFRRKHPQQIANSVVGPIDDNDLQGTFSRFYAEWM